MLGEAAVGRRDKSSTATTSCDAQWWLHVPAGRAERCRRGKPVSPRPAGALGGVLDGRAGSREPVDREDVVTSQDQSSQSRGGSEKDANESPACCILFFFFSFNMALLRNTDISLSSMPLICGSLLT